MPFSRRDALFGGALLGGAALVDSAARAAPPDKSGAWDTSYSGGPDDPKTPHPPGQPNVDYTPVITPNGESLPFKVVDGVKVYHLVAEEVTHEFAPGLTAKCWGYNGRVHGPTLEAVEGDRVRVYVTNRLPEPTTVHWHGVYLPNGMDGTGGLTQKVIQPGATFKYEWTFRQSGTLMYHPHHDEMTQMALGMMGLVVVHPRNPSADAKVDRDFALLVGEWSVPIGAARPNPLAMSDFNLATINAKCWPATAPLVVKTGERVRIRIGNLSAMDHHPIHLHGYHFKVVATDGGAIPTAGQWRETTVLVPTGSTRDIQFVADAPGDWAMHCHMTHHVMNQMGHDVPNMTGVDPKKVDAITQRAVPGYMSMGQNGMGDMADMKMPSPSNTLGMAGSAGPFDTITMGGMFTVLKVRDGITSYDDPGWYAHPAGSVATEATADDLARDGVSLGAASTP
ncbi:MAG: copper oxidase [Polyangiaceae bacterium]